MCKWGTHKIIHVIRRNNEYIPDGWHPIYVDACIADYVQKMNFQGILTVGCCCGHGKDNPVILVEIESVPLLDKFGYSYQQFMDRRDVVEHIIPENCIDKTYLESDIETAFDTLAILLNRL